MLISHRRVFGELCWVWGTAGVRKLDGAEAPFPNKMQLVCFSSQCCVGLLIDNWIKSEPASAEGYLLLLRDELYLKLFWSYLIFDVCIGSELRNILDPPTSPLHGVKHLPGKHSKPGGGRGTSASGSFYTIKPHQGFSSEGLTPCWGAAQMEL